MQNYVTKELKTLRVMIKDPRRTRCHRAGVFNLFYEIAPFQKMLVRIAPHKNDYCTFI